MRKRVYAWTWLVAVLMSAVSGGWCEAGAKMRVALYNEPKATDEKSREAVWKVIRAVGDFECERVTSQTVRSPELGRFAVLIFPGGTGNGQAKSLGVEGGHAVERFVSEGHGVIAICAGGYLTVEGWSPETRAIQLLNAKLYDDEHWARGEAMIEVALAGGDDRQSTRTMWYENGPIFVPSSLPGIEPYVALVRYVTDMAAKGAPKGMMAGHDAVIAGRLGKGRVVAFGPHPELSPTLNHWLVNAIRWVGVPDDGQPPSNGRVLEGRR